MILKEKKDHIPLMSAFANFEVSNILNEVFGEAKPTKTNTLQDLGTFKALRLRFKTEPQDGWGEDIVVDYGITKKSDNEINNVRAKQLYRRVHNVSIPDVVDLPLTWGELEFQEDYVIIYTVHKFSFYTPLETIWFDLKAEQQEELLDQAFEIVQKITSTKLDDDKVVEILKDTPLVNEEGQFVPKIGSHTTGYFDDIASWANDHMERISTPRWGLGWKSTVKDQSLALEREYPPNDNVREFTASELQSLASQVCLNPGCISTASFQVRQEEEGVWKIVRFLDMEVSTITPRGFLLHSLDTGLGSETRHRSWYRGMRDRIEKQGLSDDPTVMNRLMTVFRDAVLDTEMCDHEFRVSIERRKWRRWEKLEYSGIEKGWVFNPEGGSPNPYYSDAVTNNILAQMSLMKCLLLEYSSDQIERARQEKFEQERANFFRQPWSEPHANSAKSCSDTESKDDDSEDDS